VPWKRIESAFHRCSHKLFVTALAVTGNRPLAEDAVHEALVAIVTSQAVPDNPEAYLCRCVRNQALRYVKDRRRYVTDVSEFLVTDSDPESIALMHQVCRALDRLGVEQRETIVLHTFGGMSFREIAELQEISINTVASWYRRGIAALKDGVADYE
jgi:RNA polymerase sigma-70 factor (ECF subfamily)